MLIPINILASSVPSRCDFARQLYALPALLNRRSTPADVAGQPKNWRAIRDRFGYFTEPMSRHHANRSRPKSAIWSISFKYRSASVRGSFATTNVGGASPYLPMRSDSPIFRFLVGRGPVSGRIATVIGCADDRSRATSVGSQFAKYSLLKALIAYDFNRAFEPSKSMSLKHGWHTDDTQ